MQIVSRLLLLLVALPCSVHAHRLDEYLQAALIEIKPEEIAVQLNLTPGVDVASPVIWMIDRDRDGKVSTAEGNAYAKALMRQLAMRMDDRPLKIELKGAQFDPINELKDGMGIIRIDLSARPGTLRAGHHVLSFDNHHLSNMSVYLVNALLPRNPGIQIVKQERNENQSIGRIYFSAATPSGEDRAARAPMVATAFVFLVFVLSVILVRKHGMSVTLPNDNQVPPKSK
jgi:hypothetical protein